MSSRYGAGVDKGGASDVTMLVWKLLSAEPGLTRDEIFARVEHAIHVGNARRAYARKSGATGRAPDIDTRRARGFVLTSLLHDMRKLGTVERDDAGRYRAGREPRYSGDPDTIDETGTKAAEHLAHAYAKRAVRAYLARTANQPGAPTQKERAAMRTLAG